MKITRRFVLITLAAFFFSAPTTAQAKKPTFSPLCEDTPIPDPITQFESLPVHVKLAKQADEYNAPKRIRCQSKHFKYVAVHDDEQLEVVSRYKGNGRLHAKYLAAKDEKISSSYTKHGVLKAFWPNGNKQAVEYYWHGFAIGFHQYFDQDGNLAYVVNYSQSDYEWKKRIGVGDYRKFFQENRPYANVDSLKESTQLFREVYALEGSAATRKTFATARIFHRPWIALDNASSIRQWTQVGNQGTVMVDKRPVQVANNDFDYLPFAEVYQRQKQGLATLRPPQSYHPYKLACPWIDEAMHLGLNDNRFKLPAVKAYTAEEIAASPFSRYVACLAKPNADCLIEQAYENLQFESEQKSSAVNKFARAALVMGFPEWTRKATVSALSETRAHSLPSSVFAEPASLKAQAELVLGLDQEAEQSINTAFDHAFNDPNCNPFCTEAINSASPLLMLAANPASIEKAKSFYQYVEKNKQPAALSMRIIENRALVSVRQGNTAEALQLADEFFPKDNPIVSEKVDSTKEFLNAREHIQKGYLSALLKLAEGRMKNGDLPAAITALSEFETLKKSYVADEHLELDAALVFAKLGDADKALSFIPKDLYVVNHYKAIADIAVSLCKAKNKSAGQSLADKINSATYEVNYYKSDRSRSKTYSEERIIIMEKITTIPDVQANLAKIERFCGDAETAKLRFREILQRANASLECQSDYCGDPRAKTLRIRMTALDAGMVDLLWA